MGKIKFDTKQDRNNLIRFLKTQSQDKDEILYTLLEDDDEEEKPKRKKAEYVGKKTYDDHIQEMELKYKTDNERVAEGQHICKNCRYSGNTYKECKSKKFAFNPMKALDECVGENYKYWEEKEC